MGTGTLKQDGLLGHQELDVQEVREESHWLAFLHHQPSEAFLPSSPAHHTTSKMPSVGTDDPNPSGWKPTMGEVWEGATIMRTKHRVAGAACFGAADVNLP